MLELQGNISNNIYMKNNVIKVYLFASPNKESSESIYDRCLLMKHEKHNSIHTYKDDQIKIGCVCRHRPSQSPIKWNEDNTRALIVAGSIFNSGEILKPGDKFLNLFEACDKHGDNLSSKLNGVFTVILYDKASNSITIINDKFGYFPVYYYISKGVSIISSEVYPITKNRYINKDINWEAWADNIYQSSINGNKTLFKYINALPPASMLKIKNFKSTLKKYWDISNITVSIDHELVDPEKKCLAFLEKSVKRRISGINEVDILLSGGHDSRCLASLLKKEKVTIKSFTSQKEYSDRRDMVVAEIVADKLNISNQFIDLTNDMYKKLFFKYFIQVEGMTDEHFWMMPMIDKLDPERPVFDGLGGDILFGKSYVNQQEIDEYIETGDKDKFILAIINRRKNRKRIMDGIIDNVFIPEIGHILKKSIDNSIKKEIESIPDHKNAISLYLFQNKIRRGVSLAPFQLINSKKECLMPFLDNELAEYVLSISQRYKSSSNFYNNINSSINPEAGSIPYESDSHTSIKTPQRKYFPYQNEISKKAIDELFHRYDLAEGLQKGKKDLVYPNSKFVQFHLWYNIFYKQYE